MTQHEQIAQRAYEIWQSRGGSHGRHEDDWRQAEEELRRVGVELTAVGENKLGVIRELRSLTGLGLPEARELIESAPRRIVDGVPRAEAERICARLAAVGATAEAR